MYKSLNYIAIIVFIERWRGHERDNFFKSWMLVKNRVFQNSWNDKQMDRYTDRGMEQQIDLLIDRWIDRCMQIVYLEHGNVNILKHGIQGER